MHQCTRGILHTCNDVARIVSITTRGYLSRRDFPINSWLFRGLQPTGRCGGRRQQDKTVHADSGQERVGLCCKRILHPAHR